MHTRTAPRVIVTDEMLRAAWRHHAAPGWPASFEACMAHPLYSRLLRCHAIAAAVTARHAAQRQTVRAPVRPVPPARPAGGRWMRAVPGRNPAAAPFDARRACANDRDEPDDDDTGPEAG